MVVYTQTWAYGGADRVLLGSITPDLYKSFDYALNSAKEAVESYEWDGYVYDAVNNILYIYNWDDDTETGEWTEETRMLDDDELWDLTDGSTDASSIACIFAQSID